LDFLPSPTILEMHASANALLQSSLAYAQVGRWKWRHVKSLITRTVAPYLSAAGADHKGASGATATRRNLKIRSGDQTRSQRSI
jgi:hypothetical protein